jgi:hypothetical protein
MIVANSPKSAKLLRSRRYNRNSFTYVFPKSQIAMYHTIIFMVGDKLLQSIFINLGTVTQNSHHVHTSKSRPMTPCSNMVTTRNNKNMTTCTHNTPAQLHHLQS